MLDIEKGRWHNLKSQTNGTVLLEAKDGSYELLGEGDILGL